VTRGRGGRPSAPWLVAAAGLGFLAGIGVMTASSRLTAARTALVAGNWTGNAPDARAQVEVRPAPLDSPRPVSPAPAPSGPPIVAADPIEELRKRDLRLPVKGLERDDVRDTFNEMRGGVRRHEALDILAPRDTPVLAVDDGTIAKLFLSKPGGITIYSGTLFPEWKNDIFISGLASTALIRLMLRDDKVVGEERLLTERRVRIRDVVQGPEGALYVVDETSGKTVNWAMEMANPNRLMREGWTRDTLKVGSKVIVEGSLARSGNPLGNARTVVLAETGQRLFAGSSENN
jgi:hypothetical protein